MNTAMIKVVKVDGVVYLGEIGLGTLAGIQLERDRGSMTPLDKSEVARFFRAENLSEFINLSFNENTSSIMTRTMDDDEEMLFMNCSHAMATSKKKALALLENKTFNDLLGK